MTALLEYQGIKDIIMNHSNMSESSRMDLIKYELVLLNTVNEKFISNLDKNDTF